MTEHLQRVLAEIAHLPPEIQDEVAEHLEAWALTKEPPSATQPRRNFAGIWKDRLDLADMIDELERMRYDATPTAVFS